MPLFETTLSNAGTQSKMSNSREIWYGSYFYVVYYGNVKKRRLNRCYHPSRNLQPIFLRFLAELDSFESFKTILFFSQKRQYFK